MAGKSNRKCLNKRMRLYRRYLMAFLFLGIIGSVYYSFDAIKNKIPDKMNILINETQDLKFGLPVEATIYKQSVPATEISKSNIPKDNIHLSTDEPYTFGPDEMGSYTMEYKLFGFIDLKKVDVEVVDGQTLIPCGLPAGIYIETNGVLIIGTGSVTGMDGMNYEPAYNIVKSGDYITSVNGIEISKKQDLIDEINQNGDKEVILTVRRKDETMDLKIKAVETSPQQYKTGIWVRDNTQGIGTVTFIDHENGFGALGHGINDIDTSTLLQLKDGILYDTQIISILKGEKGSPGELTGVIDYNKSNIRGEITKNTSSGIFGKVNSLFPTEVLTDPLPIGMKQEVKTGPAQIRSSVNGTLKDYNIMITEIKSTKESDNKGMVIQVVDEELLGLTGGIVQGMSGSPIIQNNKLIGAVTHVFVQDATQGFGIFVENMLQAQKGN